VKGNCSRKKTASSQTEYTTQPVPLDPLALPHTVLPPPAEYGTSQHDAATLQRILGVTQREATADHHTAVGNSSVSSNKKAHPRLVHTHKQCNAAHPNPNPNPNNTGHQQQRQQTAREAEPARRPTTTTTNHTDCLPDCTCEPNQLHLTSASVRQPILLEYGSTSHPSFHHPRTTTTTTTTTTTSQRRDAATQRRNTATQRRNAATMAAACCLLLLTSSRNHHPPTCRCTALTHSPPPTHSNSVELTD